MGLPIPFPIQHCLLKASLRSLHETHMERRKEKWSVDLRRSFEENENEKPSKGSGMVSNTKHISYREALQQNMIVSTSPGLTNCLLTSTPPGSLLRTGLIPLVVPGYSFISYMPPHLSNSPSRPQVNICSTTCTNSSFLVLVGEARGQIVY